MPSDPEVPTRRDALEAERLALQAEITGYPLPAPACDVYYNDLLERRGRVCEELAALKSGSDATC